MKKFKPQSKLSRVLPPGHMSMCIRLYWMKRGQLAKPADKWPPFKSENGWLSVLAQALQRHYRDKKRSEKSPIRQIFKGRFVFKQFDKCRSQANSIIRFTNVGWKEKPCSSMRMAIMSIWMEGKQTRYSLIAVLSRALRSRSSRPSRPSWRAWLKRGCLTKRNLASHTVLREALLTQGTEFRQWLRMWKGTGLLKKELSGENLIQESDLRLQILISCSGPGRKESRGCRNSHLQLYVIRKFHVWIVN